MGQIFLGDISVPMQVYSESTLNLKTDYLFTYSDILAIE